MQALAQQVRGTPIGFANPALYQRAGGPALRDVVKHTLPDGTPPTAAAHRPFNQNGELKLFSLLGRMPYEGTEPATPDTTPGYDEGPRSALHPGPRQPRPARGDRGGRDGRWARGGDTGGCLIPE
jgi:hypothetical protein